MIAVQIDRRANIWLASAGDTSHPRQLTTTNYDGLDGLSCLPDGRIFYTQQAGDEENIWVTDPDGTNSRQLTSHCGLNLDPVASPDGRFVAFVSTRSGHHHIWRIDADGKNPIELTQGNMDTYPDVTPDGKWVTYTALVNGRGDIFRVPIEGGQVERVTSFGALSSAVSPDGNFIAVIHRPERIIGNKIATYSFRDSSVRLISDLPAAYGRFRWTPDGLGIAYSERKSPGGNIWVQPISGGTPRQLTFWKAAPVFSFAWSQDGKWLAYAVGTQSGDAVQITDTGR